MKSTLFNYSYYRFSTFHKISRTRLYDKIPLRFWKLIFPHFPPGEFASPHPSPLPHPPRRRRHEAITRERDSRLRRDYAIARSSGIGIPITCALARMYALSTTTWLKRPQLAPSRQKKPAVDVVPDPPCRLSHRPGLTATSARRDVEVGHPAEDRPRREKGRGAGMQERERHRPAGRSVAAPSVVLALLRGPRIIASSSLRLVGLDFASTAPKRSSVIRSINPGLNCQRATCL